VKTSPLRAAALVTASLCALCALCAASSAFAQQNTGIAAVDSAAVARAAWSRAAEALNRKEVPTARREIDRAAQAWPAQPAYVWARALLAARAHDSTAALQALEQYAALGLGADLYADTSMAMLAKSPVFKSVAAEHAANRAPLARSRVRATLADSTFWPEGMDYDSRGKRFFVASIRHRTIAEIDANGATRELWPRDHANLGAVFGVRVDAARGVLWATTSGLPQTANYAPADSSIAALLKIRLRDGVVERRWDLPPISGGHILGDLAVGPAGDVYVTDSNEPVLYRLRPGGKTLEPLRHPLFHSLQGVAPDPSGRMLIVADYSHGLLRVDLETQAVVKLEDAPHSTSLGCDGIAWDRGAVVAVQNGVSPARVMRFVLDPSRTRIESADVLDRNSAIADEPTIGAVVGGEFVYVANGQFEKYDDTGKRRLERPLTSPVLLSVPLPPSRPQKRARDKR
jgi:sugar lactone lactonase YvrE